MDLTDSNMLSSKSCKNKASMSLYQLFMTMNLLTKIMKRSISIIFAILAFCQFAVARQPQQGYRGFLEFSASMRTEKFGFNYPDSEPHLWKETTFYKGLTTSHGYQINSKYFVGAGLGLEHYAGLDKVFVPFFIQGRTDLKIGKFAPFGDVRLGLNLSEGRGAYFSPTVGYRFNWGRKMGINAGLGISFVGYKSEQYEFSMPVPGEVVVTYIGIKRPVRTFFSFRIGRDF